MPKYTTADSRIWRHCDDCGDYFYATDPKRTKCLRCKPVGKAELNRCLHFDGAHSVLVKGQTTSLLS